MTIETDEHHPAQYLDYVEFCLSECDTGVLVGSKSNEITSNNLRKWPKNRIVDVQLLEYYKKKYQSIYNIYQELILLCKIENINNLTSYIPLWKIFENSHDSDFKKNLDYSLLYIKKKSLIETKILKTFTRHKELNWLDSTNSLYPIKTIGDGNCLCHAVLSYLIGMQDINLCLRETLRTFMNHEFSDEIKSRWVLHRKADDIANAIETDDSTLDKEWTEIKSMKPNEGDKQDKSDKDSVIPLLFLEDIHIFALANLLKRPIIVISLETIKNIQPIDLRGIYLPIFNKPSVCVKDPIVIGFHNFHFMPLLFGIDENEPQNEESMCSNNETFFHFENIDSLESIDENQYEQLEKLDSRSRKSLSMNHSIDVKKKTDRFYNLLPLVYYQNLKKMKIHFLTEIEEKSYKNLLIKYLNLVEIETTNRFQLSQDLDQGDEYCKVLCCYLSKDTHRPKKDGILTYLNFLNETIKTSTRSTIRTSKTMDEIAQPPQISESYNSLSLNSSTGTICKGLYCTQIALLDRKKYYGFCIDCFRKEFLADNSSYRSEQHKPVRSQDIQRKPTEQLSQRPKTSYSNTIQICKTEDCRGIVQSSDLIRNDTPYCKKCQSAVSVNNQKFEIPIHFENNRANISAYNTPSGGMTHRSKLYNMSVVSNQDRARSGSVRDSNRGVAFDYDNSVANRYNNTYLADLSVKKRCLKCNCFYEPYRMERNSELCLGCITLQFY